MPPHEDEPLWPSADTDETEPGPDGDRGATAEQTDSGASGGPAGRSGQDGKPAGGTANGEITEAEQRKVKLADQATLWVQLPGQQPQADAPLAKDAGKPDEAQDARQSQDAKQSSETRADQDREPGADAARGHERESDSDAARGHERESDSGRQTGQIVPGRAQGQPEQPSAQEMTQQMPVLAPWAKPSPPQETGQGGQDQPAREDSVGPSPDDQPTQFTPRIQPGSQGWFGVPSGTSKRSDAMQDAPTMLTPVVQPGGTGQPPQDPPTPIPPAGSAHALPVRIEPAGEVSPVEAAAGETPVVPPADGDTAAGGPRRRKVGFIYSGVALLVVIVVGVALALPYVSNRLGLPWAPNLPKGDTPQPPTVNLALHAPSAAAPTPTNGGVSSALAGPSANPTLGTLAGIVIDPATGGILWDHDSGQALTPASTTKVLTTSAALLQLDHGLQIPTKVVQGNSPDTAIIVAGGDITLSSLPDGKEGVYQGAAHLDDLVNQVKQASGGTIKRVQIDLSAFTGPGTAPGWAPEDTPSTYATQIVPAMLDGGMSNPSDEESMRSGNPAGDLLQVFAQRLGASVAPTSTAKAPQGAKVLGEVSSAPVTELIAQLLEYSDNELAEVVGRQTAIATGQPATFAGVAKATLNVLSQNGFDVSGVNLNDGSGLSTLNKVSAKLLAQLLSVAAAPEGKDPRSAKLRPLLEGLPVAGGSGTLAARYSDPNSSVGKGWIRAKTGTLSGVNTLAGLVLDKDGRVLVFALMSNNNGDINATRAALDAVAAKLRGCGCQ